MLLKKISVLMLFVCSVAFAQSDVSTNIGYGVGSENSNDFYSNGTWVNTRLIDRGVVGSVYVFAKWNVSKIYAKDGNVFSVQSLNLNTQTGNFEASILDDKGAADKIFVFDSSNIEKVIMGGKKFIKVNTKEGFRFMEVIYSSDNFSIYKLYYAFLNESPVNPLTHQKQGKDRMLVKSSYYRLLSGKLEKVKMKKKMLYSLFGENEEKVIKYIKENRLSIKNESHLNNIFNYLRTL